MYQTPPMRSDPRLAAGPGWSQVIAPRLPALIGLFLLTVMYRYGGPSYIARELHMAGQSLLLYGLLPYLIAAAIALTPGLLLGGRFPTAATVPAVCLMLLGALVVALTPDGLVLLVGRLLGGLGAGAVIGATFAVIRRLPSGRGAAAGLTAGLGVLALVIAPVLGSLISGALSFRLMYLIGAVFVFLALIVAVVIGIVTRGSAKPPAQPMPYGAPYQSYPPQGAPYPPQPAYPPQQPYPPQGQMQPPYVPQAPAQPQQAPVQPQQDSPEPEQEQVPPPTG